MNDEWLAVIGVSTAVMALVHVATVIGLFVAVRRIQTGVKDIENRVEAAVEEFRPQLTHFVEEARAASATAHDLVADVRRHLDSAEETARAVGQRLHRVVDGVQAVTNNLPVPMKVSGSAAMTLWASVRLASNVITQLRERRRQRNGRARQERDPERYIA